jgi:hypothetical protein
VRADPGLDPLIYRDGEYWPIGAQLPNTQSCPVVVRGGSGCSKPPGSAKEQRMRAPIEEW